MKRNLFGFKETDAKFDKTRTYRYCLMRAWNDNLASILWIMLNPSTANKVRLDPTLTRCRNFSKDWGYGSFYVANLYAYRATNPEELVKFDEPVGRRNDNWIIRLAARCETIVVGWGAHEMAQRWGRAERVLERLIPYRKVWCLGKTAGGFPRHPLYVPMIQKLEIYREKRR